MLSNLELKILKASKAYYEGNPIMSDYEFDMLESQLVTHQPDSILLSVPAYGYKPQTSGLLTKQHLLKDLHGFNKSFVESDFILRKGYYTPKYDGASVTLYYKDGELELALTRGDGSEGSDVTDKLKYIVPTKIDPTIKVVSGEWIISKTSFRKHYPDSIAHRNVAVGFLMRKEYVLSELMNFSFVAYRVNQFDPYLNKYKSTGSEGIRETLKAQGFETSPIISYFGCLDDGTKLEVATYSKMLESFNSIVDYMMDGIVYESEIEIDEKTGVVNYKNELAYKSNSEVKESIVTSIEWNHTRTGKFVPVVNYQEIELSGARCSRATGFNAMFIKNNQIGIGSEIKLTRSGEIIPYIISATPVKDPIKSMNIPLRCEDCGSLLEIQGVDLVCPNPQCIHKSYNRLYNYIKVNGSSKVKGASDVIISALIEELGWKDPVDIYVGYLSKESIYLEKLDNRFGKGTATYDLAVQVLNELESPVSLSDMILGLGIPRIGWSTANLISSKLKGYLDSDFITNIDFTDLPGVGQIVNMVIISNLDMIRKLYKAVKLFVGIKSEEEYTENSSKIKVCITGPLPSKLTKAKFYEKYKDTIVESNVKDADYVISSKEDSSKTKEARRLEKVVLSESDFINLIS